MATITLNYNARNVLINSIINTALLAGARQVPDKKPVSKKNNVAEQYARLFGSKKQYTDNEIFVFNSMRNTQKILERLDK